MEISQHQVNKPAQHKPETKDTMTANEHFEALMLSMPMIESDYDEKGNVTREASTRVTDWAWEQLSEAERKELEWKWKMEKATAMLDEYLDKMVAEGKAERCIGPEGQECFRIFEDRPKS